MLYFCFIGELEEICSNLGVANLFLAVRDMLGRHYIHYSMWQFVAVVNAVVSACGTIKTNTLSCVYKTSKELVRSH